jgi:hypothetical protein
MSRRRVYPWPETIGAVVEIPAPDDTTRILIRAAATKFGNRRGWVLRTRYDGVGTVRVWRAA